MMTSEHHVQMQPPQSVEDLFQRGKIVGLFGNPNTGKTTWALETSGHVISQGGSVVYLDFDNFLSCLADDHTGYAEERLRVPLRGSDSFLLTAPETMEEGLKVIDTAIRGHAEMIILDCVNIAMPEAYLEESLFGNRDGYTSPGILWRPALQRIRGILQSAAAPPGVLVTITHRSWWLLRGGAFWQEWQANTDVQFGLRTQ